MEDAVGLLHTLRLATIAVAGLLLYRLVLGALMSLLIRGVQRNRPIVAAPEPEAQQRRADRWSAVPGASHPARTRHR